MFDYERHDPKFSEEKIVRMQNYFQDTTDVGKLYLNYPMIESYQHLFEIPEEGYADRFVPVTLQPGSQYKNLVKNTLIAKMINLPYKMEEILANRFQIVDGEFCNLFLIRFIYYYHILLFQIPPYLFSYNTITKKKQCSSSHYSSDSLLSSLFYIPPKPFYIVTTFCTVSTNRSTSSGASKLYSKP